MKLTRKQVEVFVEALTLAQYWLEHKINVQCEYYPGCRGMGYDKFDEAVKLSKDLLGTFSAKKRPSSPRRASKQTKQKKVN